MIFFIPTWLLVLLGAIFAAIIYWVLLIGISLYMIVPMALGLYAVCVQVPRSFRDPYADRDEKIAAAIVILVVLVLPASLIGFLTLSAL
jgi:hypothetical protein